MTVISFIIPAYNEAKNIRTTIESVGRYAPTTIAWEVVVVDNGSEDRTAEEAAGDRVTVVPAPHARLGDVRNIGAKAARGDVFVLLDADMSLTEEWERQFPATLASVVEGPEVVTGSWCEVAPEAHWAERTWELGQHRPGPIPALGGAHLIVSQRVFWKVGGFPSEADSGEDELFCRRAWELGIPVVADPRLRVIHRGVGNSLREFFNRHLWHGVGDLRAPQGGLRLSKTGAAAIAFAGGHLLLPLSAYLWGTPVGGALLAAAAVLVLGLPALKARRGLVEGVWGYARLWSLYYMWFWARAAAWIPLLTGARPKTRRSLPQGEGV